MAEGDVRRRVGGTTIEIDAATQTVTTRFADGQVLVAAPNYDDVSIERARDLGYTGTDYEAVWAMTRDHDYAHTLVAEAEGKQWSHTLHAVAEGKRPNAAEGHREECLVLLLQRVANRGFEGVMRHGSSSDD